MKILFFGTPHIAARFLDTLITTEQVVGVIAQPDKPSGRGQKLQMPPVKTLALQHALPVFQPQKYDASVIDSLKTLNAEVGVVVSYGKLIPEAVFTLPFYGCFNIHFSLLPNYRGAAPIQWALLKGETVTGVTTFWLEKTLDSGPILIQKSMNISSDDDTTTLTEKLIVLGIETMKNTLARLKNNDCVGTPQSGTPVYAPTLKKTDGRLNWNAPAPEIINRIRALKHWPGAYSMLSAGRHSGTTVKITKAHRVAQSDPVIVENSTHGRPGHIRGIIANKGLVVGCGNNEAVLIEEVHPENRKPMSAIAFLAGEGCVVGDILFDTKGDIV